jgi:hypothetical protein
MSNEIMNLTIYLNKYFEAEPPNYEQKAAVADVDEKADAIKDVDIVFISPKIEHNMLGVIMGLGLWVATK